MKSIEEVRAEVISELGEDKYIIIYNGKVVSNDYLEDEVRVTLREEMEVLYAINKSSYEAKNQELAPFTITIRILKSMMVKIINLYDKEKFVHKVIKTKTKVKTQICDIYLKVDALVNVKTDVFAEDSAEIDYLTYYQRNSVELVSILNTFSYANSKLNTKALFMPSSTFKFYNTSVLLEEGATLDMFNVIINNSNKKQDFSFDAIHKKGNTKSKLRNYAIAKDSSIIILNHNGKILKNAKASDLNQKSRGLLLGEKAEISANPKLEIDENDVVAAHGASIGALDDDAIFYLMSRGLTKDESEELLVNSYIEPFLNVVCNDSIKEYFKLRIKEYL